MPEPALDLTEIIEMYKEDARRMIKEMRLAIEQWDEVARGGVPRSTLRRISHQLRGSGRTYGFHNVTRISKALEHIIMMLEKQVLAADDRSRQAISVKVKKLSAIFEV